MRGNGRRWLATTGAILVGIVVLGAVSSVRGTDTGLETFEMGPYRFRVPRGYVESFRAPRGDEVEWALTLRAKLPDMEPRTRENDAEFDKPGFNSIVTIRIVYNNPTGSPDSVYFKRLMGLIIPGVEVEHVGGFDVYKTVLLVEKLLYVERRTDGLPPLILTCTENVSEHSLIFNAACSVSEEVSNKLHVRYIYSKNYLTSSATIHENIHRAIRIFLQNS